jgi:iron complex transport system ATP-binding protein
MHTEHLPSRPLLVAREVSYRVGQRTLVDRVSLTVERGEVLAVIGPNGAGKSTLLHLLSGDLPLAGGTVALDGEDLRRLGAREQARQRAVLRQATQVLLGFHAVEVVLMGRYPHLGDRREGPADLAIVARAMEQTETLALADQPYPTLSGGEGARVQLARVLAQTTPLLLLDEPTAALDLRHQHSALALARAVAAAGGGVLVVLHDLNLAATYADRLALLAQGRLVALGTPWQVLEPTLLTAVYGVPVVVQPHPAGDWPLVLATPHGTSCLSAIPERERS